LILPSAVIMTIIGAGGQGLVNKVTEIREEARNAKPNEDGPAWMRSKFSPVKKLTDQEYEDVMEEKKLKLDAEIALIDDKIAELRAKGAANRAKIEKQAVAPQTASSEPPQPSGSPKVDLSDSKKEPRAWRWF
jgi:hypothetical protein